MPFAQVFVFYGTGQRFCHSDTTWPCRTWATDGAARHRAPRASHRPAAGFAPDGFDSRDRFLASPYPRSVAIAEPAMPVLRSRVVGHVAFQTEATEPATGEVYMHLLAQPPLPPDAHAIADDQHPDDQLGMDRRPSRLPVERPQVLAVPDRSTDRSIERSR